MNIKGQGHADSTFKNFFSLETAGPIEAKFDVKPPWDGGMKSYSNGPSLMTNIAAISIYSKTLKNLLLNEKRKGHDIECWYTA